MANGVLTPFCAQQKHDATLSLHFAAAQRFGQCRTQSGINGARYVGGRLIETDDDFIVEEMPLPVEAFT